MANLRVGISPSNIASGNETQNPLIKSLINMTDLWFGISLFNIAINSAINQCNRLKGRSISIKHFILFTAVALLKAADAQEKQIYNKLLMVFTKEANCVKDLTFMG